jgi:hypothetical protein
MLHFLIENPQVAAVLAIMVTVLLHAWIWE